ncbi:hypothetical protein [Psychromonas sp. SR45-3]|uniref:hypothetical protein n=1 Tax=Psychromonas sp. SR45-3 TaxID=2760930 RepID=UPI0015F7E311|nr:hypothetical protein [Psychromonas sp. SR45-3]MBB1274096.1 hypothetical protein [Psychromonas sp. SR45-3]
MKKITLLMCILMLPVSVQADWKESLSTGWNSVKNTSSKVYTDLIEDDAEIEGLSTLSAARQKSIITWDKMEDRFADIIEVKEDKSVAPESAFFKKNKAGYQEDIDDLLGDIYAILNDDIVKEASNSITQIDSKMLDLQAKASQQKSKSVILIGEERQDALQKQQEYENDIEVYQQNRQKMIEAVQARLDDFGTELSFEQVEALLVRVNADDILAMTTVFPVISEIASSFAKITAASGEDLNNAKKYYSMYVVLLELQLYIQERYIGDLKYKYLPRIDELQSKQNSLINSTQQAQRNASSKHKVSYSLNLKSQNTTLQAIKLYKVSMQQDLNKMSKAHALLMQDYTLAVNTLNTVTMSSQVSSLITDSNQLFDRIMALQAPELVPFNNIQMQKEFSALTEQIK